jgi:hypothetical protein
VSNEPLKIKSKGPHSRGFARGAIGSAWDGRSAEGRFLKKVEHSLLDQLGHEPSFAETILIRRAARTTLQLELLDQKFTSGNWTMVDGNIQGGLANNLRLILREIGISATSKAPRATLAEYLSAKAAK